MSNIHGFGNVGRSNDPEANRPLLGPGESGAVPFMSSVRQEGDPRKENFGDMLKFACCPTLRWKSFIAIITIFDIVAYIFTLAWDGPDRSSLDFLTPKGNTLELFGERSNPLIRWDYQIWRFLTPIFLHANFLHIFFNMCSQLIFGSQVELMLGFWKIIFFYAATGIGGNLLGSLISSNPAVGASTSIVGFLGLFVAYLIVNWDRLSSEIKCFLGVMIGYIVVMNLLFSVGGDNLKTRVDHAGHLGGLLSGVFIGMWLLEPKGSPAGQYEIKVKKVGYGLTAFFYIVCILCFYLALDIPKPFHYSK